MTHAITLLKTALRREAESRAISDLCSNMPGYTHESIGRVFYFTDPEVEQRIKDLDEAIKLIEAHGKETT